MISSSVGWNLKPGGKSKASSPLLTTTASSIIKSKALTSNNNNNNNKNKKLYLTCSARTVYTVVDELSYVCVSILYVMLDEKERKMKGEKVERKRKKEREIGIGR